MIDRKLDNRSLIRAGISLVGLIGLIALIGCGTPGQVPGKPYHHLDNGQFRNPPGSQETTANALDMFKFFVRRMRDEPPIVPEGHSLSSDVVQANRFSLKNEDTITWLGHAAFLLKINDKTILTDPFLSNVAGPAGFGPERYVAPGLSLDDLPPIDFILVSHNHYDHLDEQTVEGMSGKEKLRVIVPLALGEFFRTRGYVNVHEYDWYEGASFDGIEFQVLPAIHFSRRGVFDRNRTLWGGFAIRSKNVAVYHSGDTGYGPVFSEIGRRTGPFDLALVAIGAYEPRKIMRTAHVTPEEAVALVDDVNAQFAIGMHWGTVQLTDEPVFEPPVRFRQAAAAAGWPAGRAQIMAVGETRKLATFRTQKNW